MFANWLSRPVVAALVCAVISIVAWGGVWWGLQRSDVLSDAEGSPEALAIGVGIVAGVIAPLMLLVFLRGVLAVRAARRGDQALGRWTVSSAELVEFARNDVARNALGDTYRNSWSPPRRIPAEGIEIVFVPDAVLVGGSLFPLTTTGGFRFNGVEVLPESPLAIEFGVFSTDVSDSISDTSTQQVLRLPVSRVARAELSVVLDHFRRVDSGELIVNPRLYLYSMRAALVAAPILFFTGAAGLWLSDQPDIQPSLFVLLLMSVGGIVGGFGALAIAGVAWMLHRAQVAPR